MDRRDKEQEGNLQAPSNDARYRRIVRMLEQEVTATEAVLTDPQESLSDAAAAVLGRYAGMLDILTQSFKARWDCCGDPECGRWFERKREEQEYCCARCQARIRMRQRREWARSHP